MDGFPRTLTQAQAFDEGLHTQGRQIDTVIYLDIGCEELYRRIVGRFICKAHQHIYNVRSHPPRVAGICDLDNSELYQRSDDQGEAVRSRLDTFFTQTIHLLDYYRSQKKAVKVNGDQTIEKVHQDIIDCLRVPEPFTFRSRSPASSLSCLHS